MDAAAMFEKLTLKSVDVRAVLVPLRRPVVSKVGLFKDWPLILIDLHTQEGSSGGAIWSRISGTPRAISFRRSTILPLRCVGNRWRRSTDFQGNRRLLNLIGYEGVAMIAVSGLDMAMWDALAKAAGMPLAVLLGGTLGPVPAYNSNGLWLTDVDALAKEAAELVAEGGFKGLKLRLGRDRLADDSPRSARSATAPATTSS